MIIQCSLGANVLETKRLAFFCRHRQLGVTDIPRKPNYDFERREREKTKAGESAKKAQAKADKKAALQATPNVGGSSGE